MGQYCQTETGVYGCFGSVNISLFQLKMETRKRITVNAEMRNILYNSFFSICSAFKQILPSVVLSTENRQVLYRHNKMYRKQNHKTAISTNLWESLNCLIRLKVLTNNRLKPRLFKVIYVCFETAHQLLKETSIWNWRNQKESWD